MNVIVSPPASTISPLRRVARLVPRPFTVIDPNMVWTIEADKFASKSRNCPFDGWDVTGRATTTIVGGKIKLTLDPDRIKGGTGNYCDTPQDLLTACV